MTHQYKKLPVTRKMWMQFNVMPMRETLTGRPHDTSVQKATSENENVDAV